MTELLIRRFIKGDVSGGDPAVRAACGKLAGIVGLVCNLLLCAGKFIVGVAIGSLSVQADAVNNLSDASSSAITLLGFRIAEKPADEEHPYGHARFEYVAGMGVSVIILVIGVELARGAVTKILHPEPVRFTAVTAAVLVLSIAVKLWMAAFNRTLGKRIGSATLEAAAQDSRNDVLSTSAVLFAAMLTPYTSLPLDGWMGLAVAVFIVCSGIGILKDTLSPLLGEAPSREMIDAIEKKVLSFDGVLGTHDLMVHDYGPGRRFASLHVEMAAEDDVMHSHEIIDTIERDFLENDHIHLVIHFDPILTGEDAVGTVRQWVSEQVRGVSEELSIHDFRMIPRPTNTKLIFDVAVPRTYPTPDAELRRELQNRLHVREGDSVTYDAHITFDRSYAPIQKDHI